MLNINAIKIEINTSSGLFVADATFGPNLNIIRGDNTSGKSTLIQSLFYGLGLEELIGAKGNKTMQYVLKDYVINEFEEKETVIDSCIYVEVSNSKETITTKRFIKSSTRDHRLIDVYFGKLLDEGTFFNHRPMFLHDGGAASDEEYGFHAFFEKFLGWDLPVVNSTSGNKTKLYLQTIFAAFFIEQKKGWSDYLATIPILGIKNVRKRVLEFTLNLDILLVDLSRQDIKEQKRKLKDQWNIIRADLFEIAKSGACGISGLPKAPDIITDTSTIKILYRDNNDQLVDLGKYIEEISLELKKLEANTISTTGSNIEINEAKLEHNKELLNNAEFRHNQLWDKQVLESEKLGNLNEQLTEVLDQLRKNKAEKKLKKFGHDLEISLSEGVCPACNQKIKDMTLPQDLDQVPMTIEENIKYLEAQKKMLEIYIGNQAEMVDSNNKLLLRYRERLQEIRAEIRQLKRELIADERLPSEKEIEERIKLRTRLDFYAKLRDRFYSEIQTLEKWNTDYRVILSEEEKLPDSNLSKSDEKTISDLTNYFKELLAKFNYSSKELESIGISSDQYLPVELNALSNLKFDSSASDFVRSIWAFTCALYKVSLRNNGNHPQVLIMDEPEQHSMDDESTKALFKELSQYQNCQTIFAASFHNKDAVYKDVTKDLEFNLIRIDGRLMQRTLQ